MLQSLLAEAIQITYEPRGILSWLIIGLLAGWLAGKITKGRSFGLLGNMIIGILGAMLGGFIFGLLGIVAHRFLGSLVMATVGSLLLLYLLRSIKQR